MGSNRIVLVEHDHSPGDDRANTHLSAQGFDIERRYPFDGDVLGAPDDSIAGTVIYGGSFCAPDTDTHPFMADEARWVEQCMARDIPVLGICLGAQIIAHALGAYVGPPDVEVHEFGYYPLMTTEAGREIIPDGLVVTQAHFHGFDLPDGADLLARSELFPNQAFRYGETTFGFQSHPECHTGIFQRWQNEDWGHWGKPGAQTREQQDVLAKRHDATQGVWFHGFLDSLFGMTDVAMRQESAG